MTRDVFLVILVLLCWNSLVWATRYAELSKKILDLQEKGQQAEMIKDELFDLSRRIMSESADDVLRLNALQSLLLNLTSLDAKDRPVFDPDFIIYLAQSSRTIMQTDLKGADDSKFDILEKSTRILLLLEPKQGKVINSVVVFGAHTFPSIIQLLRASREDIKQIGLIRVLEEFVKDPNEETVLNAIRLLGFLFYGSNRKISSVQASTIETVLKLDASLSRALTVHIAFFFGTITLDPAEEHREILEAIMRWVAKHKGYPYGQDFLLVCIGIMENLSRLPSLHAVIYETAPWDILYRALERETELPQIKAAINVLVNLSAKISKDQIVPDEVLQVLIKRCVMPKQAKSASGEQISKIEGGTRNILWNLSNRQPKVIDKLLELGLTSALLAAHSETTNSRQKEELEKFLHLLFAKANKEEDLKQLATDYNIKYFCDLAAKRDAFSLKKLKSILHIEEIKLLVGTHCTSQVMDAIKT